VTLSRQQSLHFLAYLILVFLLWFTVSNGKKVKWRKALPWWVFLTMVAYGIIDEWLQSYAVGRSCDAWDLLADLTSTITGLVLFSVLSFWPAGVIVTAITIFGVAGISQTDLTDTLPAANAAFHLFAYAILTAFWIQCLRLFMSTNSLWQNRVGLLAAALAVPMGLVLAVEIFSVIIGKDFAVQDMIISIGAITAVVVTIHLAGLFHQVKESRD